MCDKEIDIPTFWYRNGTTICKTYIFQDTIHYLPIKMSWVENFEKKIIAGGDTSCRPETKTYNLFPK